MTVRAPRHIGSSPGSARAGTCSTARSPVDLEPLEPRLLLNADLAAGIMPDLATPLAGDHSPLATSLSATPAGLTPAAAVRPWLYGAAALPQSGPHNPFDLTALDRLLVAGNETPDGPMSSVPGAGASDENAVAADVIRREIVFVDAAVDDYRKLLTDLAARGIRDRSVSVHVLDAGRSGIDQISEILRGYRGLDTIHLVSHAGDGALRLGTDTLDRNELDARRTSIASWSGSLGDDADLLIYGCDLAASDAGRALVDRIAALTGADVAASDDRTGSADLGGDWRLEYSTGAVDATMAFSAQARAEWHGVLAYIEKQSTWSPSTAGSWETMDLGAGPINIPADAVVEVAMSNTDTGTGQTAGVRAVGSSLERKLTLNNADTLGGKTYLVMHVQADASAQIETYASSLSEIEFTVLGYWDTGTYVEANASFTPAGTFSWNSTDLGGYGVGSGQIAEIVMTNESAPAASTLGVREIGSALNRVVALDDGSGSGATYATMFVAADDTVGAAIETYAEHPTLNEFFVAGFWNNGPGEFFEVAIDIGSPTIDASWDNVDLTAVGVPHDAVARVIMANAEATGGGLTMGVRGVGSGNGTRYHDLDDAVAAGGTEAVSAHVNTGASATVDLYHADLTKAHSFTMTGFWVDSDTAHGTLWLSTDDDVSAGGSPGIDTWTSSAVLDFGGPGATLDPDTTSGVFSQIANLRPLGVDTVTALHVVGIDITVGSNVTVDLEPGDLLFSTGSTVTLTNWDTSTISVDADDVVLFRPRTDYTAGSFSILLNSPLTLNTSLTAISLVESDTTLGNGTQLDAGDFLLSSADIGAGNLIHRFVPDFVGVVNDGASGVLIDGTGIGISTLNRITGVDLIEENTIIGGAVVSAGHVLVSRSDDGTSGTNAIATERYDILAIDVTSTGFGSTAATARLLFDGSDVDLDASPESINGLTLVRENVAPTGANGTLRVFEDTAYTFSQSDFGFSDSDGDDLSAVKVTTLPGAGALTLAGGAVTAGDFVSAASIAAGDLVFMPGVGATGAGYTSFTFQVEDDGFAVGDGVDLDPTPNTLTVNLVVSSFWLTTNGNTDPSDTNLADWSRGDAVSFGNAATFGETTTSGLFSHVFTILEDTGAAINDANLRAFHYVTRATTVGSGASTFDVLPGDVISAIKRADNDPVTLTSTNTLSITRKDIFVYRPDSIGDYSSGTFSLLLKDPVSNNIHGISLVEADTYLGDTLEELTAGTLLLTHSSPGDHEDVFTYEASAVGAATSGIKTLLLEGSTLGFTDKIAGIEFIETDTRVGDRNLLEGRLLVTIEGSNLIGGVMVEAHDVIELRVSDTELGGGTAATVTMVFDGSDVALADASESLDGLSLAPFFSGVNGAPGGADGVVSALEEGSHTFAAADFGFTDGDGDNLLGVKIATLPGAGTLTNNAIAVNAGDTISVTDIGLNRLLFTPAPDGAGTGYASFTFQVQDDGGTAGGGIDLDPSPNTLTVDVTAVNDAPALSLSPIAFINEVHYDNVGADTGEFVEIAALAGTDLTGWNLVFYNGLGGLAYRTTPLAGVVGDLGDGMGVLAFNLPADGIQNGDPGGDAVALVDAGGKVIEFLGYEGQVTALDGPAAGMHSLDIGVSEDGVTPVGQSLQRTGAGATFGWTAAGAETPDAANTGQDFNAVTALLGQQVLEDGTLVFSVGTGNAITATDPDTGGASDPLRVTLSVASGKLTLAGTTGLTGVTGNGSTTVVFDGTVTEVNTALDGLVYAPDANFAGDDLLTVVVDDQGNVGGPGPLVDTGHVRVTTVSVNDAPAGTSKTVTAFEDTEFVFAATDFGFTDTTDGDALVGVKFTTVPAAGALTSNGATVNAGDTVSATDIGLNRLKFLAAGDANATGYTSFTFQVQDDGGTANTGVDLDPSANTITVDVTAVNDAPAGTSKTVTAFEDTEFVFAATDFGFTDTADGDALRAVQFTTVPAAGALTNNGAAVNAGDTVSATDIGLNRLKFLAAGNANATGYTSFTFQVQDDGGTANTGVDLDPSANTITVDVTAVNDAPAGTSKTVTAFEDTEFVFAATDFGFTDTTDGDALVGVKFTTVPAAGALTSNGATVNAGDTVSATDIGLNRLKFLAASDANATGYTSFTFQVQDDGGTANTGVDLDPSANTITVDVTAVNDAPAGTSKTVTAFEDTEFVFAATDFGFTDTADGDALRAVQFTTIPVAGTLTNNGAAVNAGDTVSATDIGLNRLKFLAAGNANATGYTSFTFQVQDDGGTANTGVDLDPSANTITVDVTAVNDAPAGTSKTVTAFEDTEFVFAATDFGFTDTADGDALRAVQFTTVPAAGALTNNGAAVNAGDTVSATDIGLNRLKFLAAGNANATGYTSFTFQVQDDGGTANTGVDLDPSANTITVDVTAVNDAPAGTSKTVTAFEDTEFVFAATDFGFTDTADGDALRAVQFTTVPAAGALTNNGAAVNAGDTVSATDIGLNRLKFLAAGNANATGYTSFTFQVQDDGGTANTGVDLDPSANTITVDVTAVNDAPAGTSKTVTAFEDTEFVFAATDFGFTDTADGDALLGVKFTTVPAAGALTNNGAAVNAGDTVSATDIGLNRLKFLAAADASGSGYTSFTFQVQDDGGTANTGVDLDPSANTITVDVTAVNDAPAGTSKTVTAFENTDFVFAATDFGFTDTADGDALRAVQFTTIPVAGTLTSNGVAVNAGDTVSATDIGLNRLKFTPAANVIGTGYTSFTFQVQDDGGTANAGVDLDPSANTITVDVAADNDAPAGADRSITTFEDTDFVFAAADFGFADADGDALLGVKFTTVPAAGTLTRNGVTVNAGDTVSATDIGLNRLQFTPAGNASGAGYASFTFQVQDDGGTANAGVDLDPIANTIKVDVVAVNDAPAGTSKTVTAVEDTDFVFAVADFGFTDTAEGNALRAVQFTTVPAAGALTNNGVAVNAGDTVSATDIGLNRLQFTPAGNASGAGYASFTFQVQDDGGTASGGADLDPSANTLTIDVTPVNDAPAGADKTITTFEDTGFVFATADFGFADADGDALSSVTITSTPASGTLTESGVTVTAGDLVSAADIAAGKLVFTPATDANGPGYTTFAFKVQDDGGTASGGVDLATVGNRITVDVTAVSDAPSGADSTVTLLEDQVFTFTPGNFGFTDPRDGDAFLSVEVTTAPDDGVLTHNGIVVAAGSEVSASDIALGRLQFTPAANANGAGYASLTFKVRDDGGTANSGVDVDATANRLTLDVLAVNDAPSGSGANVDTVVDTSYQFGVSDFGYADTADGDAFVGVRVAALPTSGRLTLNGAPVTTGALVTATDIALGRLSYTPAAGEIGNAYATFSFRVVDGGGTAHGGVDQDAGIRAISIDVKPRPEPPAATRSEAEPAPEEAPAAADSTPEAPLEAVLESEPEPQAAIAAEAPSEPGPPAPEPVLEDVGTGAGPDGSGSASRDGQQRGEPRDRPSQPATTAAEASLAGLISLLESSSVTAGVEATRSDDQPDAAPASQLAALTRDFDLIRDEISRDGKLADITLGARTAVTTGLSVGYVAWLIRGGVLLSSVISSLPAWRFIDPLPVFAHLGNRGDGTPDDDESLENIVENNTAAPYPAAPDAVTEAPTGDVGESESGSIGAETATSSEPPQP